MPKHVTKRRKSKQTKKRRNTNKKRIRGGVKEPKLSKRDAEERQMTKQRQLELAKKAVMLEYSATILALERQVDDGKDASNELNELFIQDVQESDTTIAPLKERMNNGFIANDKLSVIKSRQFIEYMEQRISNNEAKELKDNLKLWRVNLEQIPHITGLDSTTFTRENATSYAHGLDDRGDRTANMEPPAGWGRVYDIPQTPPPSSDSEY